MNNTEEKSKETSKETDEAKPPVVAKPVAAKPEVSSTGRSEHSLPQTSVQGSQK